MRLEELVSFFDQARETGALPANAVHNLSGAISAISHTLQNSERTIEFVQNNGDLLRGRLASAKPDISRQTIEAYVQRAAAAIAHFLAWKTDPIAWEKEMTSKSRKKRVRRVVKSQRVLPLSAEPESAPVRLVAPDRSSRVQIPTEDGKTIALDLPESFTMNDVLRVIWALAAQSRDFDPEILLKRVGKPLLRGEILSAQTSLAHN